MDLGTFLTLTRTFGWDEDGRADSGRLFLRFRCSICLQEVSLEEGKANSNRLGKKGQKEKIPCCSPLCQEEASFT